ncbi:MAG TPA: phosphomannomutase, partial [Desulfobacteraceae bacterium]|nr:phosphomannomutase [Desulfobacteraceae bacterium]
MKPHIFREYDIRGIYPDELMMQNVNRLGRAIGTYYLERRAARISIGRDCRMS